MSDRPCPFCRPDPNRVFHEGKLVIALWDNYPVAPGHVLLIPKRHVATWFDATSDERSDLISAIDIARNVILSRYQPDGFNLGVNIGEAAGQTVFHLHVHVIPRYRGDVEDPTGGVRHVIPTKANYLKGTRRDAALRAQGDLLAMSYEAFALPHTEPLVRGDDDPLLPHLMVHLDRSERVDMAVAFVLESGVELLEEHLRDLLDRGARIRLLTGDYLGITDPQALLRLLDLREGTSGELDLRVFETQGVSFHPKAYIFHFSMPPDSGVAYVGSSNLSAEALGQGIEWNYRVIPAENRDGFQAVFKAFESLFRHPKTRPVDIDWIQVYSSTRRPLLTPTPAEILPEKPKPPPEPHRIQNEALKALELSRAEGNEAGLVVMATGLGKTWLAAFDSLQFGARRVLSLHTVRRFFVKH
jgi:diadenosine tetraphosphate (Ap4A) HIT family hydrolase/HKD family nuclease